MLLERPGELVTRGEIRKRFLPGDTFVDSDHGLNHAVNRFREAIGDQQTHHTLSKPCRAAAIDL
jgi:cholera toxin transcriptional activator